MRPKMTYKLLKRALSTSSYRSRPQVCIVGAGPAGFYAAMHLTKKLESVNIDILEKLPVPFGLIRWVTMNFHKFNIRFFCKIIF